MPIAFGEVSSYICYRIFNVQYRHDVTATAHRYDFYCAGITLGSVLRLVYHGPGFNLQTVCIFKHPEHSIRYGFVEQFFGGWKLLKSAPRPSNAQVTVDCDAVYRSKRCSNDAFFESNCYFRGSKRATLALANCCAADFFDTAFHPFDKRGKSGSTRSPSHDFFEQSELSNCAGR